MMKYDASQFNVKIALQYDTRLKIIIIKFKIKLKKKQKLVDIDNH